MTPEPCKALRQIELGHLGIKDFVPPVVFDSGIFHKYGVNLADLRQHFVVCPACAETMTRARSALAEFDEEIILRFGELLQSNLDDIENDLVGMEELFLEETNEQTCAMARDLSSRLELHDAKNEIEEAFDIEYSAYLSSKDRAYRAAIGSQILLASEVLRLGLVAPPASLVRFENRHELASIRIDLQRDRLPLDLPRSLIHVLLNSNRTAIRTLVRALLLREVFMYHFCDIVVEFEPVRSSIKLKTETEDRISWHRVWGDYTNLADLEINRLSSSFPDRGASLGQTIDFPIARLLEIVGRIDERTENLLDGQNAMLDRIYEMEKAARQTLEAFRGVSVTTRQSCEAGIRERLGSFFEVLDHRTREFLVSAEWACRSTPPDLDQSGTIVLFMKAFEHELHKALIPLRSELDTTLRADLEVMGGKTLDSLTLGNWRRLLQKHSEQLSRSFKDHHISLEDLTRSIAKVNGEVMAKHTEPRGWSRAVAFRELFIRKDGSVLNTLFPDGGP